MILAQCHTDRRHKAHGLCDMCYARQPARRERMRNWFKSQSLKCVDCGKSRSYGSGQRCGACYDILVCSKPVPVCSECSKKLRHPANLCRDCLRASGVARRAVKYHFKYRSAFAQAGRLAKQRRHSLWYQQRSESRVRRIMIDCFWRGLALNLRQEQKRWRRTQVIMAWRYRRILKTFNKAQCRTERFQLASQRKFARQLNKQMREDFVRAIRLDKRVLNGWSEFHNIIPSASQTPDEELMCKEDYEEERGIDFWRKHKNARVNYKPELDLEDIRIARLLNTAPLPKRARGKLASKITRYSPERGITQRHIKMSPTQFV